MTDREIETLIGRAAAKTRRRAWNRSSRVVKDNLTTGNLDGSDGENVRFAVDGKYFKNWQDVLTQFKKDLEGIELNEEQQDIYDVVTQQKDKIRLRINDLNELEDVFLSFGTRKKGVKKFISVHYAGLRNSVTALEVLNIGDVIRRGKLTEEGTEEHPTSRRYELQAEDGATLKVIIDFNSKNDKNKSVINFYSDRPSDTGAHNVSSGIITDLQNNIQQLSENANGDFTDENGLERTGTDGVDGKFRLSVAPEETEWEKAVISVLRPVVGESVEMDKAEIAAKVKELYGLDLSPDDANLYAYLAAAENRKVNTSRQIAANRKRAFEHLEDVNTYFYFFRQSGENMVINPGKEYEGLEVSGSFISENFRKYSAITQLDDTGIAPSPYRKKAQLQQELRCILQSLVPTDEGIIFWQED